MKRLFATIAALVPLVVAAPLSAHHPAADYVSDEIYDMIEQNLLVVDSPHLTLDLYEIMDGTEMTLTVTGPLDVYEVAEMINDIVDEVIALRGQGVQDGSSENTPSVVTVVDDGGPGPATITITIISTAGGGPAL